jgi:hypothetical protein
LDKTTPDGAIEPVSVLDNAIKQIKAYLKDPVEGPDAKIQSFISAVKVVATNSGSNQQFDETEGEENVVFDVENVDANNNYNPALYKFTAPESGLYLCIASIGLAKISSTTPAGIRHQFSVYVDGTAGALAQEWRDTNDSEVVLTISRLFDLSAGQTLQARYELIMASGNFTVQLQADPRYTIFQVVRLATSV